MPANNQVRCSVPVTSVAHMMPAVKCPTTRDSDRRSVGVEATGICLGVTFLSGKSPAADANPLRADRRTRKDSSQSVAGRSPLRTVDHQELVFKRGFSARTALTRQVQAVSPRSPTNARAAPVILPSGKQFTCGSPQRQDRQTSNAKIYNSPFMASRRVHVLAPDAAAHGS